jgi:hypothetical protein
MNPGSLKIGLYSMDIIQLPTTIKSIYDKATVPWEFKETFEIHISVRLKIETAQKYKK